MDKTPERIRRSEETLYQIYEKVKTLDPDSVEAARLTKVAADLLKSIVADSGGEYDLAENAKRIEFENSKLKHEMALEQMRIDNARELEKMRLDFEMMKLQNEMAIHKMTMESQERHDAEVARLQKEREDHELTIDERAYERSRIDAKSRNVGNMILAFITGIFTVLPAWIQLLAAKEQIKAVDKRVHEVTAYEDEMPVGKLSERLVITDALKSNKY